MQLGHDIYCFVSQLSACIRSSRVRIETSPTTRWKVALQGLAISRLFFTAGGLDSHLTTAVYHSETEKKQLRIVDFTRSLSAFVLLGL